MNSTTTILVMLLAMFIVNGCIPNAIMRDCIWNGEARVWLDKNENGLWDADETPLANVSVIVDDTHNGFSDVGRDESDFAGKAYPSVWLPGCPRVRFKIFIDLESRFRSTTVDAYRNVKSNNSGPFDFGLAYTSEAIPTVTPLPPTPVPPVLDCSSFTPLGNRGWIWDIEITPTKDVWVASNSGSARFDPNTESWDSFTDADGLVKGIIRGITADFDDSLWFISWDGEVVNFDGVNWRQFTKADGLISDYVLQVSIAPDNSVWFATRDGVTHWDRNANIWISYTKENGLFGNSVNDILFTPEGRIWFTKLGAVTSLFPAKNSEEEDVWTIYPASEQLRQSHLTGYDTAFVSPNGSIWFSGQRFFNTLQDDWVETVYDGFAYDLVVDSDGGLWIARGDDIGVIYISDPLETPEEYWTTFGEAEGIKNNVRSIAIDKEVIWLGTEDATVFRCNLTLSN